MKVYGRTPIEGQMTPRPPKHWITIESGVDHNPAPSTKRGRRRLVRREQKQGKNS